MNTVDYPLRYPRRLAMLALSAALCGVVALPVLSAGPQKKTPAKKPAAAKTQAPKPAVGGPAFVDNTPLTEDQKIIHALDRLGFGPRPGDVERVRRMGLKTYVEQQLAPEKIDDAKVEAKLTPFAALAASPEELTRSYQEMRRLAAQRKKMQADGQRQPGAPAMEGTVPGAPPALPRREMMQPMPQQGRKNAYSGRFQLPMAKVVRAVESERQLNEVLVDFWSNHFNIDMRKGLCQFLKIVDEREVIRPHTLGTFRDLLGASAKSPAMLFYLDNAQSQVPQPINRRREAFVRGYVNKNGDALAKMALAQAAPAPGQKARGGINENYAREIMELHTLGVDGGYTQKDVQEVARCLTGWGFNRQTGTFVFNRRGHDTGEKHVLGQRIPAGGGIEDGEKVLDILASHPSTAKYISRKLCQRFVSDAPPAALVERCAQTWKRTDGDLREVVRAIVTSPEFFSRAAYKQKIKSPFEFAVTSVRALGGEIDFTPRGNFRRGGGRPGNMQGMLAQTLVGQIATMGQPLFQYQAPTGYPEDSRKWVSNGALISRLNFALGLASGKSPEVRFDAPVPVAEGAVAPAQTIESLSRRLLNGEMSPSTRATLLKQAEATPTLASESTTNTTTAMRLTALVLGSPEFQRR